MTQAQYSRTKLENQYYTDDERLEIVCCWHQLYDSIDLATFDRYPELPHPDIADETITPDFLVTFEGYEYVLIGEICRLPAHDGGFAKQMAQPVLYSRSGPNADVMLLIPYEFAERNEKRALEEGLLQASNEQVLLVSYVRDDHRDNSWWLFKRASRFRDVEFRDEFVGEWSLKRRLTDTLEGVHVPSKRWGNYKALYPMCNDAPSAIYMACLLWDHVFPRMVTPEQYEEAAAGGSSPVFDLLVGEKELRDRARDVLGSQRIRTTWIRDALGLLKDAKRAEIKGDRWLVSWGQLRAPREDIRDFHLKLIYRLAPQDFEDETQSPEAQGALFTEDASA